MQQLQLHFNYIKERLTPDRLSKQFDIFLFKLLISDHLAAEHDAALGRRSVRWFKICRLKTLQNKFEGNPKADLKYYFYDLVVRNVNYFQILSIKIAQKSTSQICWLKNCIQVRKSNFADPKLWVENTSFVQKLNLSTFSFASTTSLSGPKLSWDGDQNDDLDADPMWRIVTCDWLFSSSV